MAEDRPQARGEGEADLVADLDLVDAGDMVLDGVLDGDDLDLVGDDAVEGGVQGRRLSRAGGAGDKEDAVGAGDHGVPAGEDIVGHAQVVEAHEDGGLGEESEDDALAEEHGDDADAEVELLHAPAFGAVSEGDAPVLGDSFFGDVEVGHDLQAADDGRAEAVDGGGDIGPLEHAVDPVADEQLVLVGLDVDIGGPLVDGLDEQVVD